MNTEKLKSLRELAMKYKKETTVYDMPLYPSTLIDLLDTIDKYREALEFYQNVDNWNPHVDFYQTFSTINEDDLMRIEQIDEYDKLLIGGKRAREALKEDDV